MRPVLPRRSDFTFGTEPRVDPTLRSDGVDNFDVAAFKKILFGMQERLGFEFRVEVFNLFNQQNSLRHEYNVLHNNNGNFGVVTSTDPGTNPRLIQFASKLSF